jgi:hypothetical protein
MAQTLLTVHRIVTLKVELFNNSVKVESTPEKALIYPDFVNRKPNALQIRMGVLAYHAKVKLPPDVFTVFSEWDAKTVPVLRVAPNFACGDAGKIVANALAWDADVKTLILPNAFVTSLNGFLQNLLSASPFLARLSLDDYVGATGGAFNLQVSSKSKLNDIAFRNCHPSLILAVLNGMKGFEGRITTVSLSHCKFSSENFQAFFKLVGTLPAFMSLANLRLEEGTADELDVNQLADFLSVPRIKNLSLSKCKVDLSRLLDVAASKMASVRSLFLVSGKLCEQLSSGVTFSSSLAYIDLTRAQVSPAAFGAFLREVATKPRRQPLALNVSELACAAPTEELLSCFVIPDAQPVLAELNYSGNDLPDSHISKLLNFLRTQKFLMYLTISRCIKPAATGAWDQLAEFVIETRLAGLEIGGDPAAPLGSVIATFFDKLIGKAALHSLVGDRSRCGDSGLQAIARYVDSNPKLASLACDGTAPQNAAAFRKAYEVFARVERVATPRMDLASGAGITLPHEITAKQSPKSAPARLNEYESLNANTGGKVQPMNALLGIMSLMVTALKNPDTPDNIFLQQDIVSILSESVVKTNVALKAGRRTQSPLFELMSPDSQTAEQFMTTYQTMHIL